MTTSSLYGSSSSSLTKTLDTIDNLQTLSIVAAVVGICGAITLAVTVLNKKNDGKATGLLGMLYDTFTFKKFWLEDILKITYIMATIYVTIMSFGMIQLSWKLFFMLLIGGNLGLRMAYEASLMFVGIYENTKAMAPKQPAKAPVPPQRPVQQPVQRPVQPVQQQVPQQPVQPVQPVQPMQQPVQPQQPPVGQNPMQ